MAIDPTRQVLERAVRQFVAVGSGLPERCVIPSRTDGPAPKDNYATLLLFHRRPLGQRYTIGDRFYQHTRASFSVQFYRKGAADYAECFEVWAGSPLAQLEARKRGLIFVNTSGARELSQVISSKWEERVALNLVMTYTPRSEPQEFGRVDVQPLEIRTDNPDINPIAPGFDPDTFDPDNPATYPDVTPINIDVDVNDPPKGA